MFKSLIKDIQKAENQKIYWGLPLVFGMLASYIIAMLALGLLPVTTLLEDDVQNPNATSIFAAAIIGGVVMLWVITRNVWSAIIDEREEAKHARGQRRQDAENLSVLGLLRLQESQNRPIWSMWFWALALLMIVDAIALSLGRGTTLGIGLDRLGDSDIAGWLVAVIALIIVRPLTEQIIFQGLLYPVVVKQTDDNLFAVLITAVAFAAFNVIQVLGYGNNWTLTYWGLLFPLVVGLCAGAARAATKSTYSAIGVQAMSGLFLLLIAAVTYSS